MIEGDISKFFDTIDHSTLLRILGRSIDCPATIALIKQYLEVGYLDPITKKIVTGTIGTPQGSVLSPLLSNIVLHELDKFIMNQLKAEFTVGKSRKGNPKYRKLTRDGLMKDPKVRKLAFRLHSVDYMDPNFKRIHYVRYADDWVILVAGSFKDAQIIKQRVGVFLRDKLALTLSDSKTKITNLRKETAKFLGIEFFIRPLSKDHIKPLVTYTRQGKLLTTRVNPRLIYHAPIKELLDKLVDRGFARYNHIGLLSPISKAACTA